MKMKENLSDRDHRFIELANELALKAESKGNSPYGAVLVGPDGAVLLQGENSEVTGQDPTGHAELNILRNVFERVPTDILARATLYASGEPCAMCSAAIVWSGVSRIVYGVSIERMYALLGESETEPVLKIPCREILSRTNRLIEVTGPVAESYSPSRGE